MFLLRSLLPIEQDDEEEVLRPESALPRRAPTAAPAGGEEEVAENIIFERVVVQRQIHAKAGRNDANFSYLIFSISYQTTEREIRRERE